MLAETNAGDMPDPDGVFALKLATAEGLRSTQALKGNPASLKPQDNPPQPQNKSTKGGRGLSSALTQQALDQGIHIPSNPAYKKSGFNNARFGGVQFH